MPKILTVDDSRAVRMIVSKQARELGFEVEEAEDGEQGLMKLEEDTFDLVILDITMPVLDGPGMLTRMREAGNQTPVLMLTSESKRSIIAQLIKTGIADYILKPFKAQELQAKIMKALKMEGSATGAVVTPVESRSDAGVAAVAAAESASPAGGKQFVDVLVVDDMENVHKRLRQLLPERLTMASAASGQLALGAAREKVFRVVLMDNDLSDVSSASLMKQIRVLQPHAAFFALALRTVNNVQTEARDAGFDGVLFKPFNPEGMEDFLLRYFDNQDVISKDDNVVRVSPFKGREARLPGYFVQLGTLVRKTMDDIAAACYAELILDLSAVPPMPDKVARLVCELNDRASKVGVELRLVGDPAFSALLKQISETKDLIVFGSVADARTGKAA